MACIALLSAYFAVSNQKAICSKAEGQHLINSRLKVLNTFAASDKEAFYFYDAYDFIAASADTFSVYDGIVNTDSLGNWYIHSSDYYKRNAEYGIITSVDGLTDANKNIYYAGNRQLKKRNYADNERAL